MTAHPFSILNVLGPYREPREAAFSYDYTVHRPAWPTPQAVRVKVSIADELDYFKIKMLGVSGGSPGQQLRINQMLSRRLADRKLDIANEEGLFLERLDVKIEPFTGPFSHLFPPLEAWMREQQASVREEIRKSVGI